MLINIWVTWNEGLEEFEMMWPTTCILVALTHLAFRAPFKVWRWWETPFVALSTGLLGVGAFNFVPEEEEFVFAFQAFLALFAILALLYGFFCTAIPQEHPLREAVIAPTKKVSSFGIVGADFGLVACPFAFVFFLVKYYLKKS